ncbi:MAG: hypothetical protein IJ568_05165 [Bacilli bacterium]|nr:hypothetical protein [Bacilli bacterium]
MNSAFGASNCSEGTDENGSYYRCSNEKFLTNVNNIGYVEVEEKDNRWNCSVDQNGNSECKQMVNKQ